MSIQSPCRKNCTLLEDHGAVTYRYRDVIARLYKCEGCGYRRFSPFPDPSLLDEFYGGIYWNNDDFEVYADNEYRADFTAVIDELQRVARRHIGPRETLSLHDFGCGAGSIVAQAQGAGLQASGSDLSQLSIDAGLKRGAKNLRVETLDDKILNNNGPYDICFMSHSLEHVLNPVSDLKKIGQLLAPDGVLIVRVPNSIHLLSQLRRFQDFHWAYFPSHLHYFSPRSAKCVVEAAGLRLLEIRAMPREDEPESLCRQIFGRSHKEIPDWPALQSALAKNLVTSELQFVACRAESPAQADEQTVAAIEMLGDESFIRHEKPTKPTSARQFHFSISPGEKWSYYRSTDLPMLESRLRPDEQYSYWIDHQDGHVVWPHKLRIGMSMWTSIAYDLSLHHKARAVKISLETASHETRDVPYEIRIFVDDREIHAERQRTGQRYFMEKYITSKGRRAVSVHFKRLGGDPLHIEYAIDVEPLVLD